MSASIHDTSPQEANKALVRRYEEAVRVEKRMEAIDELVAPDYIEHMPVPGEKQGIEGLKEMASRMSEVFSAATFEEQELFAEGDRVIERWTVRRKHTGPEAFFGAKPTGQEVTFTGIDIFRIRGDKIVEHWSEMNMLDALQQLGAEQLPGLTSEKQAKLDTYLLFDGTCKQAMEFYQSIFGGELTLSTVGESPTKAMFPPELQGRVVNARLTSDWVEVSASDWLAQNETPVRGNMMCMYLHGGTPEDLGGFFEKLSQGGTVTDPLKEQPFGWYGALNDQFGIRWMFHTDIQE